MYRLCRVTMNCSAANTSNGTEPWPPCIYCWCMLIFAYIPIVTLTVTVLVAVIGAKGVPGIIRFVLVNILAASLITIAGTAMVFLNRAILSSTDHLGPSDTACRVYYWAINTGGTARMSFMATYAIVVFVIIRRSKAAVRLSILISSVAAIWIFGILFHTQPFFPQLVVTNFLANSGCVPHSTVLGFVYVVPYAIIFILVPVTLAILLPCVVMCQKYSNGKIEGRTHQILSRAMVKFTLFLLIGNTLGAVGQSTPVVFAAIKIENGNTETSNLDEAINYVNGVFLTASFIPTPILILVYFKPVWKQLTKLPAWLFKCMCSLQKGKQWQC